MVKYGCGGEVCQKVTLMEKSFLKRIDFDY